MCINIKTAIQSKTLIISLLILSLFTLFSLKKKKLSNPENLQNPLLLPSSPSATPQSKAYLFQLSIIKRSFLLTLLSQIQDQLLEKLVILIKKPLKDLNRNHRRSVKKDKDQYFKSIITSIEQEKNLVNEAINQVLAEHNVNREQFNNTLEMYKNDHEVLSLLSNSALEPSTGTIPTSAQAEEILTFEQESLSKSTNTPLQKCQIEDEIWEKWEIELGDIHLYCKNHPTLKIIHNKPL